MGDTSPFSNAFPSGFTLRTSKISSKRMGLSDMVCVSKTEEKEKREARGRRRVRGGEGAVFRCKRR